MLDGSYIFTGTTIETGEEAFITDGTASATHRSRTVKKQLVRQTQQVITNDKNGKAKEYKVILLKLKAATIGH